MIYPKIEDLRKRKVKLRTELERLDKKIRITGERLAQRGVQSLLQKGAVKTPFRSELEELEKRHLFLQQVDKQINIELVRAVRHNRVLTINRLEREIKGEEKGYKKLYEKKIVLLKKIEKLKKKGAVITERKTELKSELINIRHAEKRPTVSVSLRLNQLESFLSKNVLIGDDLKIKVLEARKHNKEVLKQASVALSDVIYRNFEITYNRDTGQTVKLGLLELSAVAVLRATDKKDTLTKKEMIEEVT